MMTRIRRRQAAMAELAELLMAYEALADDLRTIWPELRALLPDDTVTAVLVARIDKRLAELTEEVEP